MSTSFQLTINTTNGTVEHHIGASQEDAFNKAVSIIDSTDGFVSATLDSIDKVTGHHVTHYDTEDVPFDCFA